jgi:hypothetical protein
MVGPWLACRRWFKVGKPIITKGGLPTLADCVGNLIMYMWKKDGPGAIQMLLWNSL